MKETLQTIRTVAIAAAAHLFAAAAAFADSADDAARDAALRFVRDSAPMRARPAAKARAVGRRAAGGREFRDVSLEGGGFVLVAGASAPSVIAYSPEGEFPSEDDGGPLWALVKADLAVRGESSARAKSGANSLGAVTDLRVPPLVQSKWNQLGVGARYCYNTYTPNHWYCGCVATALSQLMRYHRFPANSVTAKTFTCYTNEVAVSLTMKGGAYDWDSMPLVPSSGSTDAELEAIGKLTYDCGVAMRMQYSSAGSGALGGFELDPLKNVFGFANAQSMLDDDGIDSAVLEKCIYPNLDAGCPVLLGIYGATAGGHAIVADGYGYSDGVLYTHLNMGWSGNNDVWYNLPTVNAGWYNFSVVQSAVYNIFPSGTGEIISGRVCINGVPVAGASVAAKRSGGKTTYAATTDTNGIYAVVVPSSSMRTYAYSVTASFLGMTNKVSVSVSASSSPSDPDFATGNYYYSGSGLSCGNVWGADIDLTAEYVDVVVSVAGGGTGACSPAVGTNKVVKGSTVTLLAEEDGYAYSGQTPVLWYPFVGFSGTGSVPSSGATNGVTFVANEDSTIEWRWADEPSEALLYEEAYLDDYGGWLDPYQYAWLPYGTNIVRRAAFGPLEADEIAVNGAVGFTSTNGEYSALSVGTLKFVTFMSGPINGELDWQNDASDSYRTPDEMTLCMTNGMYVAYVYADAASEFEDAEGGTLPYWWYCKYLDGPSYYGLISEEDAYASGDPDGDGFPNWRECADGKMPLDDQSFPFNILSFEPGRISFEGSKKGSLVVDGCTSLGGAWSPVATAPAARDGVTNAVGFALGPSRFFRVRHEQGGQ